MSRNTHARIAGIAFLLYIVAGISGMVIHRRAAAGADTAAKLASIAGHAGDIRMIVVFNIIDCFCALVLAVTLYAITRQQDHDVATFGMICRVCEGLISAFAVPSLLNVQWLATSAAADPAAKALLASYLMRGDVAFTALFFAVGSTAFAWLLLRGRMIPTALAWIGVFASVLLVVCLPLQVIGYLQGPMWQIIWLPMFFFEVPVAIWFLVKGVR